MFLNTSWRPSPHATRESRRMPLTSADHLTAKFDTAPIPWDDSMTPFRAKRLIRPSLMKPQVIFLTAMGVGHLPYLAGGSH